MSSYTSSIGGNSQGIARNGGRDANHVGLRMQINRSDDAHHRVGHACTGSLSPNFRGKVYACQRRVKRVEINCIKTRQKDLENIRNLTSPGSIQIMYIPLATSKLFYP